MADRGGAIIGGPPTRWPVPVAITFDYWDTLVRVGTSGAPEARRAAMAAVLDDLAPGISDARLAAALDQAMKRYDQHWRANRQFTAEQAVDCVLGVLGLHLGTTHRKAVVAAFVGAADGLRPELTPGIGDTLQQLHSAGVRLGIVCDVGVTPSDILRDYLRRHGLLELFDHWSFSDEVGVYKPHPTIFRHALDGLGGVDPARAVHVGDLRRTDVAGARGVGMATVRYAGANDDRPGASVEGQGSHDDHPEADGVVHDHRHLPGLLGVDQG